MLHRAKFVFNEVLEYRDDNSTQYLVVHHSEVVTRHTILDIHRWHLKKNWAGVAYHFFIDKEGEIFEGRPIETVGAHAYGFNQKSVGICLEGDFNKEMVNQKQLDSAVILFALLSLIYNKAKIIPHSDLVKDKNCPGKNFPFDSFCEKVDECKRQLLALFGEDCDYNTLLNWAK